MHKKTLTHIGLIFVLFGFLSLTSVAQANIISDPSFEGGTANWQLGDYASSIVSAPTRTGSKALKLINDFDGTKAPSHNAGQYRINGVVGGKEYVYKVWVKGNNVTGIGAGGKPLVVVRWRNAAQQKIREEMYNWAPYGTYNWREMKLHMQAPSAATGVDVSFRSWWDCTGGQTFWDDVSLAPRNFGSRGSLLATYQAENANTRSGGIIRSTYPDYTGSGYYDVTSTTAILQWNTVAGGGNRVVAARYSWEGNVRYLELFVNGVSQGRKTPEGTGRRGSWATENWNVNLPAGSNTVRLQIGNAGGGEKVQPLIDRLEVFSSGSLITCNGKAVTILGTEGHDVIFGTEGPDVIHGLGTSDFIMGMGGDDVICGGDGADFLSGVGGNDILIGGDGHDAMWGGSGNDILYGEDGHDTLFGGDGNDELNGGTGDDALDGLSGNDILKGDYGNDTLYGGVGVDELHGGTGPNNGAFDNNDTCYDTAGTVKTGCEVFSTESQSMIARPEVYSSEALPTCNGKAVTILGTEGHDVIFGTEGPDVIHGLGTSDFIMGMGGDDVICGGDGADFLSGVGGNDILIGGDGHDAMWGGSGNDTLYGEDGHDTLFGGDGNDELNGGTGDDALDGLSGNDILKGNYGNDTLYGGVGVDELHGGTGPNNGAFDNNDTCYDTAGTVKTGCEVFYLE